MAKRLSTGMRTQMMGRAADSNGNGVAGILYQFVISVYAGSQPATADASTSGYTLLGRISLSAADYTTSSNRLVWDTPSAGRISKPAAAVWQMLGLAAGTAGWCRFHTYADDGSSSTTLPRIDMSIAQVGGDVTISNTAIGVGTPHTIDSAYLEMPAA